MKLKLIILLMLSSVFIFAGLGDSYEPEILKITTDAPIMLYINNMDVGFTSLKCNIIKNLEIKSTNRKQIKIISLYSMNLIEAIDVDDKVLSYRLSEYNILSDGIKEINKLLKTGKIDFQKLLDSIDGKYLSQKDTGSSTAPDPTKFVKLRRVNVFNLLVENSEGNQNKLQVFVENFQDSSELH